MSEFQNEWGEITIDDEVLVNIAQKIISETEGIAQFGGTKVLGKWGGKGIKIERDEKGRLSLLITLALYYGHPILEFANLLQKKIKDTITTMTEIEVYAVDIHIQSIVFPTQMTHAEGGSHEKS